jgi:hypothetical protein
MFLYLLVFLILLGLLFYFVYRPWQATWGATDEEVGRAMVGDEIVKNPTFNATRAVTINAPANEIWPWIVQIGYRRAGFYSWDRLDNAGIPSAEQLLPEFQTLKAGDTIPLDSETDATVQSLEPNKHLLLVFTSGSRATWAWGLYEIDGGRTRLVTRLRYRTKNILTTFTLDAFEIIMMRKCLLGIKRRAEAAQMLQG